MKRGGITNYIEMWLDGKRVITTSGKNTEEIKEKIFRTFFHIPDPK